MIRQETLDSILMKTVDWFSQYKKFMNAHTEILCRQVATTQLHVTSER